MSKSLQSNVGIAALCFLFFTLFNTPVQADTDTALIVAVDVSQTINGERYRLQMEGFASALEDPAVVGTILRGANASILFMMLTWTDKEKIVIPWIKIDSAVTAKEVAARIRRVPQQLGDFTCITHMMRTVADKVVTQIPEKADRIVLDISGDQRENCNPLESTVEVRDDLVGQGVTINGLPILDGDEGPALEDWYRENVTGGLGSFVLPAYRFADFAGAIRRKFILEISNTLSIDRKRS